MPSLVKELIQKLSSQERKGRRLEVIDENGYELFVYRIVVAIGWL